MGARQFQMLPCALPGVEAVEADSAHSFGRHTHDQFGVGLIVRGAQLSASGRGPVEAGAGDVITVNPGEVHDGHPVDENGRAWRMLYLDPEMLATAVDDMEGAGGDFVFARPVMQSAATAERFGRLYSAMTRTRPDEPMQAETALIDLLAAMMERRPSERYVPPGIRKARQRIDDDPLCGVTLADLAQASGLSRFQVVRGFALATGMTPHAYLVQRRIGIVRSLIASGMPLAEAAAAGQFADQSHMTRNFVRAYGITPGVYAQASATRPAISFKT